MAIAGKKAAPRLLNAARGVAEAELELRRLEEFRLALIEVEAAKICAAREQPRTISTAATSGPCRTLPGPTSRLYQPLAGSSAMNGGLGLGIGAQFTSTPSPLESDPLSKTCA